MLAFSRPLQRWPGNARTLLGRPSSSEKFHAQHRPCPLPRPRLQLQNSSRAQRKMLTKGRGKKTEASLNLTDVPDSLSSLAPLELREEIPMYPTVIQQARDNMSKFENCVLLTRVGGFYELYFEQAEQYGPQLNLKVGDKSLSGGRVVSIVRAELPLLTGHD